MSGETDKVVGRAKQAVGDLTNDRDLRREGKIDEAAGGLKGAIDSLRRKLTRRH